MIDGRKRRLQQRPLQCIPHMGRCNNRAALCVVIQMSDELLQVRGGRSRVGLRERTGRRECELRRQTLPRKFFSARVETLEDSKQHLKVMEPLPIYGAIWKDAERAAMRLEELDIRVRYRGFGGRIDERWRQRNRNNRGHIIDPIILQGKMASRLQICVAKHAPATRRQPAWRRDWLGKDPWVQTIKI